MAWVHADAFGKSLLSDALFAQLFEQSVKRDTLQVLVNVAKTAHVLALFGLDFCKAAWVLQERLAQRRAVMAKAAFANVATTGRYNFPVSGFDRHCISAMIADNPGCDFRSNSDAVEERADVPADLLAWLFGPSTSNRRGEFRFL
jgi:hypothetical protein